MARMQSAVPTRKVTAATGAAAASAVIVWVLNTFVLSNAQQIDTTMASSISTLLVAVVGYLVPPSARDQVVT